LTLIRPLLTLIFHLRNELFCSLARSLARARSLFLSLSLSLSLSLQTPVAAQLRLHSVKRDLVSVKRNLVSVKRDLSRASHSVYFFCTTSHPPPRLSLIEWCCVGGVGGGEGGRRRGLVSAHLCRSVLSKRQNGFSVNRTCSPLFSAHLVQVSRPQCHTKQLSKKHKQISLREISVGDALDPRGGGH